MKPFVFGIGVLLMLGFSYAGMTIATVSMLRRFALRHGPLLPMAFGAAALLALIAALAWSVPPRG